MPNPSAKSRILAYLEHDGHWVYTREIAEDLNITATHVRRVCNRLEDKEVDKTFVIEDGQTYALWKIRDA